MASTERAASGSRVGNIVLWVLQVVAAGWFVMAALGKLSGNPAIKATFDALGFGDWFIYLIAVLEIAGAVALFIPRLTGLAALALVALLVGAIVVHAFVVGAGVVAPLPLLVLTAVIAWGRRASTARLWPGGQPTR